MISGLYFITINRYYQFKSLEKPKKKAASWLRKNPMECVVWAARKARPALEEPNSTDDDDDEPLEIEDGVIAEDEKEALRSLPFASILAQKNSAEGSDKEKEITSSNTQGNGELDQEEEEDEVLAQLKVELQQRSPSSLHYRHIKQLIKHKVDEIEATKSMEEKLYQQRRTNLMARGVTKENIALLPNEADQPLPTPIRKDLAVFRQKEKQKDQQSKQQRVKELFQDPWLRKTEKELFNCVKHVRSSQNPEHNRWILPMKEILENKLKMHHEKQGTLKCKEGLEERRRTLIADGLLKPRHQHLVETMYGGIPISQSDQEHDDQSLDNSEIDLFPPPTPSYHYSSAEMSPPRSPQELGLVEKIPETPSRLQRETRDIGSPPPTPSFLPRATSTPKRGRKRTAPMEKRKPQPRKKRKMHSTQVDKRQKKVTNFFSSQY